MKLKEFFEEVGGNYDDVLIRLPSERMVKRFVLKFAEDPSYEDLKSAWELSDIPTAFRAAHTLKGTAANLGLDALAVAAANLTEQLRNASDLPSKEYIDEVDKNYQLTIEKIGLLERE